jgi:hypothetical protein
MGLYDFVYGGCQEHHAGHSVVPGANKLKKTSSISLKLTLRCTPAAAFNDNS